MTNLEIRQDQKLEGTALQQSVQKSLEQGLEQVRGMEYPEMIAYASAIKDHFNDWSPEIDWMVPRSESEIRTFMGSSVASLLFAYASIGFKPESFYGLSYRDVWWKTIQRALDDENMAQTFKENVWRSPVAVFPSRGLPLQYILRHHFGDTQIKGVDLGAGLHVALPFLNFLTYLTAEFPGSYQVLPFARPVNISLGIGIDKQDRASSIAWAKASYWPIKQNLGRGTELENLYNQALAKNKQFPFLSADVTDQRTVIQKVSSLIGHEEKVDFVFSSFVRHQLGASPSTQLNFKNLVKDLLHENGIWVDLGEEVVAGKQFKMSKVNVFKKENGQIEFAGNPFTLKGQTDIQEVNLAYFGIT